MTIAFLPWPTSIYIDQSQHAISIYMVRSPSEIQLCADTTTHLYVCICSEPIGGSLTSTTKHDRVAPLRNRIRTSLSLRILHNRVNGLGLILPRVQTRIEEGGARP